MTFEYVGTNNTDLVPHVYGPPGDPRSLLAGQAHINRASTNDNTSIDNLINVIHGVSNFVGSGMKMLGMSSSFFG